MRENRSSGSMSRDGKRALRGGAPIFDSTTQVERSGFNPSTTATYVAFAQGSLAAVCIRSLPQLSPQVRGESEFLTPAGWAVRPG